ncbi:replication protein [Bacillus testis]|uniref:replication protein n=1 Tax=Bacillus testis TaxID=1622072 RepID=UPI00067F6D6C|nr:replication protein [Bacillus testis]
MGNLSLQFKPQETFIEAWHDCYLSESKITGFICTFQLHTKKHIFYGLNDINHLLKEANKRKKDVYLSLNAFEHGSRQAASLKQIRNIGVDIDCYKLNITVDRASEEIKDLIYRGSIPNPNLVIYSGRGIQLIYSITGGASPKMAYLSQYITTQYIAQLKHLGADTTGSDVTRVFRLPYSVNGRNNKRVEVEIWRTMEYDLMELYSYCTPLESRRKPSKKRKGILATLPSQQGLKNLYSLNTCRKDDLEMLISLRNGDIEKRNTLTYIYSYTIALLLKNKESALAFAQQMNASLADPQQKTIVSRTAGSAYDDAMEFFDEYAKRDFKMWYKHSDGIKRPMKNETIIEELDITADEMKQFKTIIDGVEKQARNTKGQRLKRRKQGVQKRKDYLEQQKEQTEDKLWQLQQAMERHPNAKRKELAEMLGVHPTYITKLKKHL